MKSDPCQASEVELSAETVNEVELSAERVNEVELSAETVNELKPLQTVIGKSYTLGIWQGSEHASSLAKLYI